VCYSIPLSLICEPQFTTRFIDSILEIIIAIQNQGEGSSLKTVLDNIDSWCISYISPFRSLNVDPSASGEVNTYICRTVFLLAKVVSVSWFPFWYIPIQI
jgi:hypothetical protein